MGMKKEYFHPTSQDKRPSFNKSGRKLSKSTNAILAAFKNKFGAVYVGLLQHWPSIIGDALSKKVVIGHLKYQKSPHTPDKGILTLHCIGALIPMIQMQSPQIIHRINQYFGYSAISEIRLIAKNIPQKKTALKKQEIVLTDQAQNRLSNLTNTVSNEHLKNALHRLGESIYKKDSTNHAT